MKRANKSIVFLILLTMVCNAVQGQSLLLRMMSGFNDLTEAVGKFFTTAGGIDSQINNEKLKSMAAEFYGEISDVIFVKDSIVYMLEHSSNAGNPDYRRFIQPLQDKMSILSNSLFKYRDLMAATGIDAQKLSNQLRNDFMMKAATLEEAKNSLNNPNSSDQEVKQNMVVYFKSCINFLKNALVTLEKFKT